MRNFAVVTHAVPAERVRRHLPNRYDLETFDVEGVSTAFVSATCFCNEDFRPAGFGYPCHTFNESTYRTYVTHKGRRGVYFFRRFLGTRLAWMSQRSMAKDTHLGDFELYVDEGPGGYESYDCAIDAAEGGTSFQVAARDAPALVAPFESRDEHAQFLTYRLHGFFTSSAGVEGYMPVSHPRMRPFGGGLAAGRFDPWAQLGIVSEAEASHPYSVLVVPSVPFRLHAPRPLS